MYTAGANLGSSLTNGIKYSIDSAGFYTVGQSMASSLSSGFGENVGNISWTITTACFAGVASAISTYGLYTAAGGFLGSGLITGFLIGAGAITTACVIAGGLGAVAAQGTAGLYVIAGDTLSKALASGITSGTNAVTSAISALVSAACSTIASAATSAFNSAGYNAAIGFANGINNGAYAATIAARAMANAAASAAQKALDEHSPSKVFYGIGDFAGQGLAIGMADTRTLVEKNAAMLATASVDGFNSIAGGGLLDLNSSIVPTIDYASLSSNTGKLDFSATMNRLISDPIKTSADLMAETQAKFDASNQKIVDSLSAVQSDLSAYTDAISNTETAMYLDGKKVASSLAKPMNKAMGTLARQSKL